MRNSLWQHEKREMLTLTLLATSDANLGIGVSGVELRGTEHSTPLISDAHVDR